MQTIKAGIRLFVHHSPDYVTKQATPCPPNASRLYEQFSSNQSLDVFKSQLETKLVMFWALRAVCAISTIGEWIAMGSTQLLFRVNIMTKR